jgi:hypothetical protein
VATALRAERFEVVDASGTVRAVLAADVERRAVLGPGTGAGGPMAGLVLSDQEGRPRLATSVDDQGRGWVVALDSTSRPGVVLSQDDDGVSGLTLRDASGRGGVTIGTFRDSPPAALFRDADGTLRVAIGALPNSAAVVEVRDETGRDGARLGAEGQGTYYVELGRDTGPSSTLVTHAGNSGLRFTDAAGQPRVQIGTTADGRPVFGISRDDPNQPEPVP